MHVLFSSYEVFPYTKSKKWRKRKRREMKLIYVKKIVGGSIRSL